MANQTDPRIDAAIAAAPAYAQPIVRHLRELVHRGCPEAEETIKWSRPCFVYRGQLFCFIATFKAHVAFGFWHQGMKQMMSREVGKAGEAFGGLGKLGRLADLPDDPVMLRFIKAAVSLHDAGVPARPKPKAKPPVKVPADLAAALKKHSKAAAAWADFSPSHRREYVEWVTEAKREETRAKRLATTLEWLAAGKARNWKYENC